MTEESIDLLWLEAALRAHRSPEIVDDGFSARVLARIASPSPTMPPEAALVAVRQAELSERRRLRWTIGGLLVGVAVAAAAWLTGAPLAVPAPGIGADLAGLLVVSCSVAWLAITSGRDATAW